MPYKDNLSLNFVFQGQQKLLYVTREQFQSDIKIAHILDFDVKPNLAQVTAIEAIFFLIHDFGLLGTSNTESSESFTLENE